jgi:hypothetical protein
MLLVKQIMLVVKLNIKKKVKENGNMFISVIRELHNKKHMLLHLHNSKIILKVYKWMLCINYLLIIYIFLLVMLVNIIKISMVKLLKLDLI